MTLVLGMEAASLPPSAFPLFALSVLQVALAALPEMAAGILAFLLRYLTAAGELKPFEVPFYLLKEKIQYSVISGAAGAQDFFLMLI